MFELPEMTAAELDAFLAENGLALSLHPSDATALRVRRRRRSLCRRIQRGEPLQSSSITSAPRAPAHAAPRNCPAVLRLLILGEDTSSKLELAAHFNSSFPGDPATSALASLLSPNLLDVRLSRFSVSADRGGGSCCLEVYAPPTDVGALSLRTELWQHCDVVLVCYSVKEPRTFRAVTDKWLSECNAAREFASREAASFGTRASSAALRCAPVVFLVGLDADTRRGSSSDDAVRAAQQIRAAKYIEVQGANPSHLKSLWSQIYDSYQRDHAASAVEIVDPSVNIRQRATVAYLRGVPLYENLVEAPPELVLDTYRHAVAVRCGRASPFTSSLTVAAPNNTGSSRGDSEAGVRNEVNSQFLFHLAPDNAGGASIPGGSWLSDAKRVPSSGVISLSGDESASVSVTRRGPSLLIVVAASRCTFRSAEVPLRIPPPARPPLAYVDVATRSFRIVGDATERGELPDVHYTTDGTEPTSESPLYVGCVPLDGGSPDGDDNDLEEEQHSLQTPHAPWPVFPGTTRRHCVPTEVRCCVIRSDVLRSETVRVAVPRILAAPHVTYHAGDQTLIIDNLDPHATYRYTIDGEQPSYDRGFEYTRPVTVPKFHADGRAVVLRVVALPRLAFASREVVVNLGSTTNSSAAASGTAPSSPRLRRPVAREGNTPSATSPIRIISTTNAAIVRAAHAQQRRAERNQPVEPAMLIAPGSRSASPLVRTRDPRPASESQLALGMSPVRSASTHQDSQRRANAVSPAVHRGRGGSSASVPTTPLLTAREGSRSANVSAALPLGPRGDHAAGAGGESFGCTARDNEVEFVFAEPIALSHLTVATPGGGAGPRTYDVFVLLVDSRNWMGVGSGTMDDIAAVQILSVAPSTAALPVVKLRCVFGDAQQSEIDDHALPRTFVVRDVKVHGKRFHSAS